MNKKEEGRWPQTNISGKDGEMETNLTSIEGDYTYYYEPHCCKCYGFCNHTGGPYYCNMHNPNYVAPIWTWITPVDSDMHGKLDKIIELLERLVK